MPKVVNNKWGGIIDWGERRLPRIFFRTCYLDGKKITMQNWITKKNWDDVNKRAEDLYKNLKFD